MTDDRDSEQEFDWLIDINNPYVKPKIRHRILRWVRSSWIRSGINPFSVFLVVILIAEILLLSIVTACFLTLGEEGHFSGCDILESCWSMPDHR